MEQHARGSLYHAELRGEHEGTAEPQQLEGRPRREDVEDVVVDAERALPWEDPAKGVGICRGDGGGAGWRG